MKPEFNIKVGLALWLFLIVFTFVSDQLKIDSCLDAGNAFDYTLFRCSAVSQSITTSYLESRYSRYLSITVLVFLFFYTRGYVCSLKSSKLNIDEH